MPISDRLGEIEQRYSEWHEDRGGHTPAPDTDLWRLADHPDESMDHCIVRNDLPALVAALRDVLDLHRPEWSCGNPRHTNPDAGCPECAEMCATCGEEYPCGTRRAIANALGEET